MPTSSPTPTLKVKLPLPKSRPNLDPVRQPALAEEKKDISAGVHVPQCELQDLNFVKTTAYFLTRESQQEKKSRDALKAESRRAKNEGAGVGQLNVEAPRALHAAIKAFAKELRASGNLRDALLALLAQLPINDEFLLPGELRDLEAALQEFSSRGPQK